MAGKLSWATVAALAVAGLALTGCSAADGYSDLSREPSANDTLPSDLGDAGEFDRDSVRFVDVVGGTRLYLARGRDHPVCLVVYRGATDWQVACGSDLMTVTSAGFDVMLVRDGMPDRVGWTRAGENIRIKDR